MKYLLLAFVLLSCQDRPATLDVEPQDTLSYTIPDEARWVRRQFRVADTEVFDMYDEVTMEVVTISLRTNDTIRRIPLNRLDSVHALVQPPNFFFSGDSLWVLPLNGHHVYLLNTLNGALISRWVIPSGSRFGLIDVHGFRPRIRNGRILVLAPRADLNLTIREDWMQFFDLSCLAEISFNDSDAYINYLSFDWPTAFQYDSFYQNVLPTTVEENKHQTVVGFGITDTLYVYDHGKKSAVAAKSRFARNPEAYDPNNKVIMDSLVAYHEREFRYKELLFNPYRKVYYRVAVHGRNANAHWDWSLLVLDEDLNLIGEIDMRGRDLQPLLTGVTENGLIIPITERRASDNAAQLVVLSIGGADR